MLLYGTAGISRCKHLVTLSLLFQRSLRAKEFVVVAGRKNETFVRCADAGDSCCMIRHGWNIQPPEKKMRVGSRSIVTVRWSPAAVFSRCRLTELHRIRRLLLVVFSSEFPASGSVIARAGRDGFGDVRQLCNHLQGSENTRRCAAPCTEAKTPCSARHRFIPCFIQFFPSVDFADTHPTRHEEAFGGKWQTWGQWAVPVDSTWKAYKGRSACSIHEKCYKRIIILSSRYCNNSVEPILSGN